MMVMSGRQNSLQWYKLSRVHYITVQYITLHYSAVHYITVQYSTVPAVVPGVPVPAGVGAGGAPPAHADLRVPGARVDLVASE